MSQKERIKKALGIPMYPWSSDEESISDEPPAHAIQHQNIVPQETSDQPGTSAVLHESPSGAAVGDARPDSENLRRLRNIFFKMLHQPRHMSSSQHTNRRDLSEMRRSGLNIPISSIERVIAINKVTNWNRLGAVGQPSSIIKRVRSNRDSTLGASRLGGSNVLEVESSSDENEPQDSATAASTSRMVRRSGRRVMLAGTSQPVAAMARARTERRASLAADGEQMQTSTLEDGNEAAPSEGPAASSPPSEDHSENEEDSDEENIGRARSSQANADEAVSGTSANVEAAQNEPRPTNDEENEQDNAGNNSDDEQHRRRKRRRIVSQETAAALKRFNGKFLRVLECPVCLECMAPPLRQCGRGHLLCSRCCSRLNSCPLCRTGLSSVRNRAMEAVAELLRYPCRHGCGQERRLKHREAHEANCSSRVYKCPAACPDGATFTLLDLPTHLQTRHPAMVKRSPRHTMRVPMSQEHRENVVLMVGPELFHLRLELEQRRGIHARVAYLGPVARAKCFSYEVSLEGEQMRKLVYTRVTHSDLECSSVILRREDCFHLPLTQAPNYLRAQTGSTETNAGHLELTVQILMHEQRCINLDESES